MTTLKFQRSSLLFSKVIRIQSKQDNQVYKEMKGKVLWSQLPSDRKNIGLEKELKTRLIMRFMLQEYVEEGLLFQNIPKYKHYPCWPRSSIFSHNTKLGYSTFCWFCDAGSHIIFIYIQGGPKRMQRFWSVISTTFLIKYDCSSSMCKAFWF